ncbi:MAG: EAL domain-containing protein, partial [Paucibacter sp.]|nr:EAL domain-containing protein [Roseateles sp.]
MIPHNSIARRDEVGKSMATVLAVDDDAENLADLVALLDPDYQVLAAKSGERALQLAAATPQPDLILLDMKMPGMDGYAVISQLKANALTRNIPVLFVTAKDQAEDEQRGLTLGAADYIVKPWRNEVVRSRVRTHLELKRAQEWLARQDAILAHEVATRTAEFQSILASAREGIFGTNEQGQISFINPAAAEMLGYGPDELLGCHSRAVFHHAPLAGSPRLFNDCLITSAYAAGEAICDCECVFWRKDGSALPVEFSCMPLRRNGALAGSVVTFKDIAERKHYLAELERRSRYDELTGLPNRHLLAERQEMALERCKSENQPLAMLLIKLGQLKEINDTLGRDVGDLVLKNAANALADLTPESDTLARLSGDEFIMLHSGGESSAAMLAQSLMHQSSLGTSVGNRRLHLSAHIGIALFPRDGDNAEILRINAAAAMQKAKSTLQNAFRFYSAEMNARSLERLDTTNDLRLAIERNELVVFYQPQVSLFNGEIIGCEALIRWRHPRRGLVPPGEFIAIAEETGLIVPIGEWVLRTAFRQNKAWHDAGLSTVPMAVNISPRQFAIQDLPSLIRTVVNENELDPDMMELELTESAVMTDVDAFFNAARGLKHLNVALAIDDFGTGFSSLNHLKRLALDRLKIDISFIRDLTQDANSATIVRAIISLAHSLNLSVLAEGVETEAQLNFLRAAGCDDIQGYYFSRPVPADDFEVLLREHRKLNMAGLAGHEKRTLLI